MANNKVQLADGSVLIDLTSDTVTAAALRSGYTAHDSSGNIVNGALEVDPVYSVTKNLTNVTSSNDDTKVIAGNSFFADLKPNAGYMMTDVTVMMGGVDITSQVFTPGTGEKAITANGTYNASADGASGYSQVTVNVSNSYASSDEGKVVSGGALVSQTSASYTSNGTYDTTEINSVTINVPESSSTLTTKAITANGTYYASADNADGYSSVTVNVSGGGGTSSAFKMEDYVVPSVKWTAQNAFKNTLKTGGCVHLVYVLQANSSTTGDCNVISFGVGALTGWNPGASSPSAYGQVWKSTSNFILYLRGAGNTTIDFTSYADQSGKIDIRLYSDKWVDVNTGTEYAYTTAQQTFFTALASKNYIGLGTNQSNPLTGATVSLFALEEAQ